MNLGVLLLYPQEGRTMSSFTREWAERAIQRVADYVLAQSGGRETISFKVYDWIEVPFTAAEWSALGYNEYPLLRPSIEKALGERETPKVPSVSLGQYTHILIGVDHPQSIGGGTTPGPKRDTSYVSAVNFNPSYVAHELGHSYGAGDASGETAKGPVIYENHFCVMGSRSFPYTFTDDTLADPNNPPILNQSGPGMSAPTLMATGWLNENEHGMSLDLSDSTLSSGGRIEELSALAGAPGPLGTRPPLVIRYYDLLVEYRVGVPDGWDRGLPDPGVGAGGYLVMHRSSPGTPRARYVDSVAVEPGAVLVSGKDNPFDIFNRGPLKLSVLSFNAAARTVRLNVSRRAARPPLSGTTYEAVNHGMVWTPKKGFTPVPPHSPLLNVLEEVARVYALQELLAIASDDEVPGLSEETLRALRTLQQSVAELGVEPSVSPLAHALESISKLHGISERLHSSTDDREMTREFVEASRQQLAEVERILANAVEEDRQG